MLIKDNYAATEFKEVFRYKIKWLLKTIYRVYLRYIELYDFEDLF